MFRLAGKYVFESDVKTCRLSAHSGYEDGFVWDLDLQSQVQLTLYPSGSVRSSFGLQVYPPLGVLDWRELPGQSVTMCDAALERGFMFHYDMSKQWGDTLTLHLQFGQTRGPNIEVFAEGRGCIEAAQDIFPDGQVAFQIHAWTAFGGVGVNVPLNAADSLSYATARIRSLLPNYAFAAPVLRETRDEGGIVRAVEVLHRPAETGVSG